MKQEMRPMSKKDRTPTLWTVSWIAVWTAKVHRGGICLGKPDNLPELYVGEADTSEEAMHLAYTTIRGIDARALGYDEVTDHEVVVLISSDGKRWVRDDDSVWRPKEIRGSITNLRLTGDDLMGVVRGWGLPMSCSFPKRPGERGVIVEDYQAAQ
jgi:hypothetical protein